MLRLLVGIFVFLWLALAFASTGNGQTLQLDRWKRATILPQHKPKVDAIAARVIANRKRYETVGSLSGVPWFVIAGLHNMESSGSFSKHLHEGSPLSGRTRWEPKGRPVRGKPPFQWEASALDALQFDKMDRVNWRSLDAALYACERYNGTGYLRYHPDVPTPYLWSHTNIYSRGKYVSDGKWSPTAISAQTGIAAIWKSLENRKIIKLPK